MKNKKKIIGAGTPGNRMFGNRMFGNRTIIGIICIAAALAFLVGRDVRMKGADMKCYRNLRCGESAPGFMPWRRNDAILQSKNGKNPKESSITDALKRKNGEGYVDVAVTIMIVSFVLVFMVNIVSLVALSQNMKTAADLLVEYASANGTTAIDSYAAEVSEKVGVDFEYSFSGSALLDSSGRVQLGDKIECTLTHRLNFLGFGDAIHALTVKASATGISRVYRK